MRLLFLLLAAVSLAFSQGFGSLVGTVTDPTGAVIAGAKVTITNPATGQAREESTNAQGYFTAASLRPATYDVSATAPGFSQATKSGVTLLADQDVTVNITVSVGSATESISVTAEVAQINTTS